VVLRLERKLVKVDDGRPFGEDVSELGGGRYVKDPHLADGNSITKEV